MAKIVTKIGGCSVKGKAIGWQFQVNGDLGILGGSYALSGDTAIESEVVLPAHLIVGQSFRCKYCGNTHAYRCNACGRVICYDGKAGKQVCPTCGATAQVPAAATPDSLPSSGAAARRNLGETVHLEQGQEVPLRFADDRPLGHITVGCGWDPSRYGSNMDLDSSVIVAGNGGYETIYFGNLAHASGCVKHGGDNLTGDGEGDDENIEVYLDKVPANRDRLYFVFNIYECATRHQKLGDVKNMYIRLCDPDSGETLVDYTVPQGQKHDSALVIGVARRDGDGWSFKALGEGSRAETVQELASEAVRKY